jgi:hypothetical protein
VPEEMVKNGAQAIHLATGLVVGYPPCPNVRRFKKYIEERYKVPVVIGTHPIPKKYMDVHRGLPFWEETKMAEIAGDLMGEAENVMKAYD